MRDGIYEAVGSKHEMNNELANSPLSKTLNLRLMEQWYRVISDMQYILNSDMACVYWYFAILEFQLSDYLEYVQLYKYHLNYYLNLRL